MNIRIMVGVTIAELLTICTIAIQPTDATTTPKSIASEIALELPEDSRSDRSPWQLIKAKTGKVTIDGYQDQNH